MEIVIFNIAEPRKDRTRPNFFSDPNSFKTKKANLAISFSFVNPLVQNSNPFLEDLRRLNQLKDSPYQSDIFVEKINKTKESISTIKGRKFKR